MVNYSAPKSDSSWLIVRNRTYCNIPAFFLSGRKLYVGRVGIDEITVYLCRKVSSIRLATVNLEKCPVNCNPVSKVIILVRETTKMIFIRSFKTQSFRPLVALTRSGGEGARDVRDRLEQRCGPTGFIPWVYPHGGVQTTTT